MAAPIRFCETIRYYDPWRSVQKGIVMRKIEVLSAGLACLALFAAGAALAKSRYRVSSDDPCCARGPIDIQRRSWLDPGTQAPVGSTNRYMVQQTYLNNDPIERNQRSWYMQETLPQRPPYNADMIVPYDDGFSFPWP
ncbi:hypothetical protein [Methylocystis sp.]|uniref:hypothetical protein n=1 Tax=Methylocystis sp. TaxID=1911079 RepID=UPI0025E79A59|nr:hypothetical protein [Methylocystis sp.]